MRFSLGVSLGKGRLVVQHEQTGKTHSHKHQNRSLESWIHLTKKISTCNCREEINISKLSLVVIIRIVNKAAMTVTFCTRKKQPSDSMLQATFSYVKKTGRCNSSIHSRMRTTKMRSWAQTSSLSNITRQWRWLRIVLYYNTINHNTKSNHSKFKLNYFQVGQPPSRITISLTQPILITKRKYN